VSDRLANVVASWGAGRNVLLFGPPATGKTRLIGELFEALKHQPEDKRGILLDPNDTQAPFSRPLLTLPIPTPAKVVWTTFHQSYGYEDFVLGLRPKVSSEGTQLEPWAGIFLDAALELSDPESEYESVVIFIDEINRGNASRIFGEFMTFLDFDYRGDGGLALPLPLRQLTYSNGQSEIIRRPDGTTATIPEGFTFPKNIYIVATMNSVDRAAVPIDSALARRFNRIEMRPDLNVLANHWGLNPADIPIPSEGEWDSLTPFESGYLLLDRLNVAIAEDLGPEFELGHGLLMSVRAETVAPDGSAEAVGEAAVWRSLGRVWDEVLFPQLEDRYSGRPEQLLDLLRVDTPPPGGDYAWRLREARGSGVEARTLTPVRLSELDIPVIKRSFRWLAR
jgi:5-methylcytosine-specific restriction enzyme B